MYNPLQYAGPVRTPPPKMQARVRKEVATRDAVNARQFEQWNSDSPIQQGVNGIGGKNAVVYDMAPLSSRTDKRDFRQSQPFVADGPQLSENPYFDRYDPTRDPRNMVREVRSVVYEEKEAERGVQESQRLLARGMSSRWVPEGMDIAPILAFEVMRPKVDSIEIDYRKGDAKPPPRPLS